MKYIYRNIHLPVECPSLKHINAAADVLYRKLTSLDIHSLPISDYNKRYLNEHIQSLHGVLLRHTYLLALALGDEVVLEKFLLVDYGGGSGLLSMLAKQARIGTVIYNDIYDVSCNDARIIARSLGIEAEFYVPGELDEIIRFLRMNNLSCNAVTSHDVIEHIYDTYSFFANLHFLSRDKLNVIMATGTNDLNPRTRRRKKKMHHEAEFTGRKEEWGYKERDTRRAFFDVRKEIIRKHAPDLSTEEIHRLAKMTRGLIDADITASIDKYRIHGIVPQGTRHPTNTCDPYTGNWEERLMCPYNLMKILRKTGFHAMVLNGYYGKPNNPLKRLLAESLNALIFLFPAAGIRIAPFITIYGKK